MSNENPEVSRKSFAALAHAGARPYLIGSGLAMMADSIEHVISYWMIFEKFHSPALGGFAVISHWLPFLLFSVHAGALADRFDPRRMIQIGMGLFMLASLGWGILFFTGILEKWHAMVLLAVHGVAGVFWTAPGQILVHDIVGPRELPSAVRLLATSRTLGLLLGPAVGGAAMLIFGPALGILLNILVYVPLTWWLVAAPFGPRFRKPEDAPTQVPMRGFSDIWQTMRAVAHDRVIVSMTLMAGAGALFIGTAFQAQMPEFSTRFVSDGSPIVYNILLFANASGAVAAGIGLESWGLLRPRLRTAFILMALWCLFIVGFAAAHDFWLAVILLFAAGFVQLAFNAMAQAMVQLAAPVAIRGRVIGLYTMSALGMMTFSGVTVGIGGSFVGIHWSLALSAMGLLAATLAIAAVTQRMGRAAEPAE